MLGNLARKIQWNLGTIRTRPKRFSGSLSYWEERYSTGGNSGVGSYGKFAEFKATTLNEFVAKHNLRSVIEFGCGDDHAKSGLRKMRLLESLNASATNWT